MSMLMDDEYVSLEKVRKKTCNFINGSVFQNE